jgi:hypothetical protein
MKELLGLDHKEHHNEKKILILKHILMILILIFSFFIYEWYTHSTNIRGSQDWIKQNQIHVYGDKVVIDVNISNWATYEDTHSMQPTFNSDSNGIEIMPENENQLKIGDVVCYKNYLNQSVVHRIVNIGTDKEGKYFIMKGDNIPLPDPYKVRFNQISGVTVIMVY